MQQRPARARDLGLSIGPFRTGAANAITDVPGVLVGHTTIIEGASIRTGVTAVVPAAVLPAGAALPAAVAVGNGYGKLIGSTQIAELGVIETPVLLTATLSAFLAADALVSYLLARPGYEQAQSINPVVGETNDGFLSDIRARPARARHVLAALDGAAGGPVAEGAVGAGTGTAALGFKAGIGTSSRLVEPPGGPVTVGVLVQANFSGTLTVVGVPVTRQAALAGIDPAAGPEAGEPGGNSCLMIVATDAPLDARQLNRVARRALVALARTGSDFAGASGDYAVAFAAAAAGRPLLADQDLDPLFLATIDCAEEAILNSLFMAVTMTGHRGHTRYAVPHDRVLAACAAAGVLDGQSLGRPVLGGPGTAGPHPDER
jgi:D-aminopeptidase